MVHFPPPLAVPLCLLVLQIFRTAAQQQGLCTNPVPGRGKPEGAGQHLILMAVSQGAGQDSWGPAALNLSDQAHMAASLWLSPSLVPS